MNVLPLKQGDKRWASKYVGFGRETFAKVGCTVTDITCMINYLAKADYTPDQINDRLKEFNAFSDGKTLGTGNLVVWSRVCMAFPFLKFVKRSYNYETWSHNAEVSVYVYALKIPVLVEVYVPQGANRTKHWVLFIGNRKAIDPLTGTIVSTGKYPTTGYSLFQKI
jgi:hypothetical protein